VAFTTGTRLRSQREEACNERLASAVVHRYGSVSLSANTTQLTFATTCAASADRGMGDSLLRHIDCNTIALASMLHVVAKGSAKRDICM
jgi:hypothetical protein